MGTDRLPYLETDFLVIGSGSAGMRCAIEANQHGDVLLVTKSAISESNTRYAQGGIAVAMNDDDHPDFHEKNSKKEKKRKQKKKKKKKKKKNKQYKKQQKK